MRVEDLKEGMYLKPECAIEMRRQLESQEISWISDFIDLVQRGVKIQTITHDRFSNVLISLCDLDNVELENIGQPFIITRREGSVFYESNFDTLLKYFYSKEPIKAIPRLQLIML